MRRRRAVGWVMAAPLALGLAACGGDGGGDLIPCTPPKVGSGEPNCRCPGGTLEPDCRPDCATTGVYQDSGGIPSSTLLYDDFSVPDSGRLDMTLDWTNASSPMGLYLVPVNTCTLDEFNARQCNFLVRVEPGRPKPVKTSLGNFAAGNYRWMIANYADEQESVTLQIVLSKGTGCPSHAGGAPGASSRGIAMPALERSERR